MPAWGRRPDLERAALDRQKWLSENRLPASVKYFSLVAFTERENISTILRPTYDSLAQIDPRNDSQLIFYDQLIPGARSSAT